MKERRWRTSSYSGNQGNCVEIALGETAQIRDTKDRPGGHLAVPAIAWQAFTDRVRRA